MEQKQKNIILIVSLAVLGLVSAVLFLGANAGSEQIDASLFKLQDSKSIDKIVLDKKGEKMELLFSNNRWMVNQKYEADTRLIEVLFATMMQAIPKREVASKIRDSVSNEMVRAGIKTSFISGSATQHEFYVLGGQNGGVTYFMKADEKTPYVMVIPGYKVYVAGIFEQDANAWRDKRIFNFNWRNFKELKADFPNDPKQNFTVAMTGHFFTVVEESKVDTTALNDYLDAVSLIYADSFYKLGESAKADSLSSTRPIMTISVTDVANQQYSLSVFAIGRNERNALARWNNNDLIWFNRQAILPIYKKRKDFQAK